MTNYHFDLSKVDQIKLRGQKIEKTAAIIVATAITVVLVCELWILPAFTLINR